MPRRPGGGRLHLRAPAPVAAGRAGRHRRELDFAPGNRGFLRKEAVLAIVILSNEDDCSGEADTTFYRQPVDGQGDSLRCALLGHLCNGQPVVAREDFRAPLAACEPYRRQPGESTHAHHVRDFVDAVKAVKGGDEDPIVVASIVGWDPSPNALYALSGRPGGSGVEIQSTPICTSATIGSANPPSGSWASPAASGTTWSTRSATLT